MIQIRWIVGLIVALGLLLLLGVGSVAADHTTCEEDNRTGILDDTDCEMPVDWMERFDEVQAPQYWGQLSDDDFAHYRELYLQTDLFMHEETQENLDPLYPRERYVVDDAFYASSTSEIDDGETTHSIDYDEDDSFWSFSNPFADDDRYNDAWEVTSLRFDADIPEGSSVDVEIFNSDGVSVHSEVFESGDVPPSNDDLVEVSSDVLMDRNDRTEDYDIRVTMRRNDPDNESPEVGTLILQRDYPAFRGHALPFNRYPEAVSELNHHMYMNNYVQVPSSSSRESTSPRLSEGWFDEKSIDRGYDGGIIGSDEGKLLRHTYTRIDNIEPTVKVPDETLEDVDDWETIGETDGMMTVTYDAAISQLPSGDNNRDWWQNDWEDGDLQWEYNLDSKEYEVEVGYIEDDTFYSVEEDTRSISGAYEWDYDEYDIPTEEGPTELMARVTTHVTMEQEFAEYVVVEADCPWPSDFSWSDDYSDFIDASDFDEEDRNNPNFDIDEAIAECGSPFQSYTFEEYWDWDAVESDYYDYSLETQDTKTIDTFAHEDGPDDDDFEVHMVSFEDENWIYVDRNIDTEYMSSQGSIDSKFGSTRWTIMEPRAATFDDHVHLTGDETREETLYVGSMSGTQDTDASPVESMDDIQEPTRDSTIPGEIPPDAEVKLDIWASGDFGSGTTMGINVEQQTIGNEYISGTSSYDDREHIVDSEDVTSIVRGEEEIEMQFSPASTFPEETNSELQPRLYYMVTVETDDALSEISSRWGYAPFRDVRWDSIYRWVDDCDEDGTLGFGADGCYDYLEHGMPPDDSPDPVDPIYPSSNMPLQPHLVPTTSTFDAFEQQEYDIDVVSYAQEPNEVTSTIQSPYCAKEMREHHEEERVCNMYVGYLADQDIEETYQEAQNNENISLNQQFDMNAPIRDDDINEFNEAEEFVIKSGDSVAELSVAGNASWSFSELSTESTRQGYTPRISVEHVDTEELTDEDINEIEDSIIDNNEFRTGDSLRSYETQLKIELTDERDNPLSTYDRGEDEILVPQSRREDPTRADDGSFQYTYSESSIDTNDDGVAYITVFDLEEYDGGSTVTVQYNPRDDWWDMDEDTRVFKSASSTVDLDTSEEVDTSSVRGIIIAVISVVLIVFFIVSRIARTYPSVSLTTTDLVKLSLSPIFNGEHPLKPFVMLLKYLVIILGMLWVAMAFGSV